MNRILLLVLLVLLIIYIIVFNICDDKQIINEKFTDITGINKEIESNKNWTDTDQKLENNLITMVNTTVNTENINSSDISSIDLSSSSETNLESKSEIKSESDSFLEIDTHDKEDHSVMNDNNKTNFNIETEKKCKIGTKCSVQTCGNLNLFPVLDPEFNMREVSKQCLLLEDHLNNKRKRCFDCIRKHFLIIDGFLEEAVSLEKDIKKRDDYRNKFLEWIDLEKEYAKNPTDSGNMDNVSKKIRLFRKPLVEKYFNMITSY